MTRSELKQLIRETIEEISADTARRAADKARDLGREKQAARLSAAAQKKDAAALGVDPMLTNVSLDGGGPVPGKIMGLEKTASGKPAVRVSIQGEGMFTLVDAEPHVRTTTGLNISVDRPSRVKLVKAFKAAGLNNINPNKINIVD